MLDLVFLLAIALWSSAVGFWILRRLGISSKSFADQIALAIPLGLGALAIAGLGLGEIGCLDRRALSFCLAITAIVSAPGLISNFRRIERRPFANGDDHGWPDRAFLSCFVLAIVGTLLTALTPVTDGDALCYHLLVPKRFLENRSVFFDPDLHETVYPLLTEMLYAVGLAFRGPIACKLIQWLLGIVFALNVNALARPFLGARAWWGGTLALLVPAVSNGMSAPLNDVGLAAFGTAAIHAWARYRDEPSLRGAILLGLLTGLAIGVKYPALVLAGLIALTTGSGLVSKWFFRIANVSGGPASWLVSRSLRKLGRAAVERWVSDPVPLDHDHSIRRRIRNRRRWLHIIAFGLTAWTIGGGWYLRALVHTGNPVYPFFRSTFGGSGLDEVLADEKRPMLPTVWNLAQALGPLTLEPSRFDSVSHQFGPIFLLFLPALVLERPSRRLLWLVGLGYAFLALCLTQRQSMRFVLTAVGPLSVGVAWLADRWRRRASFPSRAILASLVVVLTFESALAVARSRHGLRVVFGLQSESAYLASREPTYRVGAWIAEHLPSDARIIGQDHRGFYIPRDYVMELAHRRRTGLGTAGETASEVRETFLEEGFTHVLMCPPDPVNAVEFDPALGKLLGPWLAHEAPVYKEVLSDADGVSRTYALYSLHREALMTHKGDDRGRMR